MESHNAQLGKSIHVGSNFFTVISKLLADERRKHHDLCLLFDGRPTNKVFKKPDIKYRRRSEFILTTQNNLTAGEITVEEFLKQVTYRPNPVSYNLSSFDTGNVIDEDEDMLQNFS